MNTRDKRNRFPTDQRLRQNGFTIKSRPERGQEVWLHAKTGEVMTQEEALDFVNWLEDQRRKSNG